MPATRRAGTKPFAIEGYNLTTLNWEVPMPGQRYGGFQAGVQLANRSGALNEIEYSEYVVKTQAFADAINATPEFPEMLEEVARARELDQFASAHDAQLGFTIRARNASWSPGYVQQNAARLGFVAGVIPGRMVLPASTEGLAPVLVLPLAYKSYVSMARMKELQPEMEKLKEQCGDDRMKLQQEMIFASTGTSAGGSSYPPSSLGKHHAWFATSMCCTSPLTQRQA